LSKKPKEIPQKASTFAKNVKKIQKNTFQNYKKSKESPRKDFGKNGLKKEFKKKKVLIYLTASEGFKTG